MSIQIAIHGAAGRMGQRVVALASEDAGLRVVAAIDDAGHPQQGQDAGLVAGVGPIGVPVTPTLAARPDVVIDFSVPAATGALLAKCLEFNAPLVIATTGFDPTQKQRIKSVAKGIPVLWSPSMSTAVNLTMKLAQIAGKALRDHGAGGADVEIIERHHRFKEDAPSGTALKFGQIIAEAMDLTGQTHGREGRPGARPHDEIGYHAVRVGDNPGEHTIVFGMLGETIELRVAATSRDCYAAGALAAAKFLAGKPPGMYDMNDVLGL